MDKKKKEVIVVGGRVSGALLCHEAGGKGVPCQADFGHKGPKVPFCLRSRGDQYRNQPQRGRGFSDHPRVRHN